MAPLHRSFVGITVLILVCSLAVGAAGQAKDVVRVFIPYGPTEQAEMEHFIEAALPHVDAQMDGARVLWGVTLEHVSPLELAERIRQGSYDVVMMSAGSLYLASQGLLADLSPFVARSGLHHTVFASMRIEGRLFDLPTFLEPLVVVYNRSLFDQHGLPYPSAVWTWDDFVHAAVTVSSSASGEPVYGVEMPSASLLNYILYQANLELVDLDDWELQYALSVVTQLVQGGALILDGRGTGPEFRNGQVAMQIVPLTVALSWNLFYRPHEQGLDWGVAPLPTIPGRAGINLVEGLYTIGIAFNAQNPATAWEVARLIATGGSDVLGSSVGNLSAYLSADEVEAWVERLSGDLSDRTKAELNDILTRPYAFYSRGMVEANQAMNRALKEQLELLLTGATTHERALQELQQVRDWLRH